VASQLNAVAAFSAGTQIPAKVMAECSRTNQTPAPLWRVIVTADTLHTSAVESALRFELSVSRILLNRLEHCSAARWNPYQDLIF